MRSLKDGRGAGAWFWRAGASICGMTGGSIFGGGGGGGSGGLNGDQPGGMTCAEAAPAKISAEASTPTTIDRCFMEGMS